MKTIFIADIKSHRSPMGGHYLPVAKNLRSILKDCCDVKIAGCDLFSKDFNEAEFIKLPYANNGNYKKEKIETFINAVWLFWKAKGNVIILQQSTVITSFIAIALFYWMTSKMYMIQYNTDAINGCIKRFIWSLAKWKIDGIICPNDRIGKAYGVKYCVVTDYIFSGDHIDIVPFEERNWDIGIVGTITKDKGSVEALEFFAKSGKKVLVAGRIGEKDLENKVKSLIALYPNVEAHIGFISDEDYIHYIKFSRFCVLNYRGTYFDRSSGVVLDILFNGTPVLGTDCSALSMVKDYGIGFIYQQIDNLDVSDLLDLEIYKRYLVNIKNYLEIQQKGYKNKLVNFIGNYR